MDKKAFIKSCHRQGYKYSHIAKLIGVSRQRVEQILHPNKHKARLKVSRQTYGIMKCEYPSCKELNAEAHHHDYSKPLQITWLCKKHHMEFHKKIEKKIKKIRKCGKCLKQLSPKQKKWCGDCKHKMYLKKARENYKNNPTRRIKQKELSRKWREDNPEKWREICRKAVKKYYIKHPEKIPIYKGYNKKYYETHKEKMLLKMKEYYQRNKERISLKNKERYKKKKLTYPLDDN